MVDKVTKFRIEPKNLAKWMHQNRAVYTGAFVDGCLLDNFVVVTKRGFAAIYEEYLNEWSSTYRVEFEPGAAQTVWSRWYQFEKMQKEVI